MRPRRRQWLLLVLGLCACALGPLAATSIARVDTKAPRFTLDYAKRQDFVGGEWVRLRVKCDERASASASGNLEVGSAAKKTYGRNLFPIGGAGEVIERGEELTLKMHVPANVRSIARKALAAGKPAIIRISFDAVDLNGNHLGPDILVIRPKV